MERNACFSQTVKHIRGKMTWAQVEVVSGAHGEVQLLASGDDESVQELRIEFDNEELTLSQPQLAFAKELLPRTRWLTVLLRIPSSYKGCLEIDTISGMILANGITGDTIKLSTISGGVHAKRVEAAALRLHSVSGAVAVGGVIAPKLRVRTVSGEIAIGGAAFATAKITNVSGESSLSVHKGGMSLELQSISGAMT
ncbi:MAG: DUF4097 domain-containing protein, partial [Clostridia bacterium]|nr:DUF4097 domain-containing protein [Clostridia bacterium]